MPLFRRRRPDPPDWASFLDADGWHDFAELVRYEAGRRGWSDDVEAGVVRDGEVPMGLTNLAQICHAAPGEEWTELVARHFLLLTERPDMTSTTAEEARAALKIRLVDDEHHPPAETDYAERRIAEDLRLAMAVDLHDHVGLLRRDDVLEWGDEDELFDLALEQTRAEGGALLEEHEFDEPGGPTKVWIFHGDSFFTATHAIWGLHLAPDHEHGTLIGVPNRHTVLAHIIRDMSVVSAVGVMIRAIDIMWAEGPGSLSSSLYWLRHGDLQRLHVRRTDDGPVFAPPDELVEILDELAAAEGD